MWVFLYDKRVFRVNDWNFMTAWQKTLMAKGAKLDLLPHHFLLLMFKALFIVVCAGSLL